MRRLALVLSHAVLSCVLPLTIYVKGDEQKNVVNPVEASYEVPYVIQEDPTTLEYLLSTSPGFSTNAVEKLTAQVDSQEQAVNCTAIPVIGSLSCLKDFWSVARYLPGLTYKRFTDKASQRRACDYTIGYEDCLRNNRAPVSLVVGGNPSYLIDGNPSTVWAHSLEENKRVFIKLTLHGSYKVIGIILEVETFLLQLNVKLKTEGNRPFTVAMVRKNCTGYSKKICQDNYNLLMEQNNYIVTWEEEPVANYVLITLNGVSNYGPYQTNHFIIREIKLLAKKLVNTQSTPENSKPAPRALRDQQTYFKAG